MIILAVDTSTQSLSVAIIKKSDLLSEITINNKQTHSKYVMDLVQKAIHLAGLSIHDMDGFAVTQGPGTFTGLRIGISTVKGFAAACGKPIVGISSLNALASQAGVVPFLICPMIDARRNEVYSNIYKVENHEPVALGDERVQEPTVILEQISEPCVFIGNGTLLYRETIEKKLGKKAMFASPKQNVIQASTTAYLSQDLFLAKTIEDNDRFSPVYIRKSDAEINRKNNRGDL